MSTYLDHAATTPQRPEVTEALVAELGVLGNPASTHHLGQAARRKVEEARERIASALHCDPIEVIFTGSATEANNLAVKGGYWARQRGVRRPVLAVSAVEHHAILDPVTWLAASQGAEACWLPVDHYGTLALEPLSELLERRADELSLVSVMWANNEVGALQPVAQVTELANRYAVPVHCDAVQAIGAVPVNFAATGLGALSVSGHKCGGPLGIGALLARRDFGLAPVLHGGGQERKLRSGTLNLPAIVGFAVAVELAVAEQADHAAKLTGLRDELVARVLQAVPDAIANSASADQLPGIAHFTFPGCLGDDLLLLLDQLGIACATGSACTAGVSEASHVLIAMGRNETQASSCLRFSLGRTSTKTDVAALAGVIAQVVRQASGVSR